MRFGRFVLDPVHRELRADGAPVAIGGRTLEILEILIAAGGAVVTKDELVTRVWAGAVVEDNLVQVHISALRKALGEDPRRLHPSKPSPAAAIASSRRSPTPPDRHRRWRTGRTRRPRREARRRDSCRRRSPNWSAARPRSRNSLADLLAGASAGDADRRRRHRQDPAGDRARPSPGSALPRRRLPGGTGAAAPTPSSCCPPSPPPAASPAPPPRPTGWRAHSPARPCVAAARQLRTPDRPPPPALAEALLRASPTSLRVLATSREPLRAMAEVVYRRCPRWRCPPDGPIDVEAAQRHSAIRLFVARALAADPALRLDARTAAGVVSICRHLDGIPLAIELAAARAAALGIDGVAARLDDRFDLLRDARRTTLARQQTLQATLDWSHDLPCPEPERVAMRRLRWPCSSANSPCPPPPRGRRGGDRRARASAGGEVAAHGRPAR